MAGDQHFIYEFLGKVDGQPTYLWYCEGKRGIAFAQFVPDDPLDKKSEKGSWYLKTSNDYNFLLDEKPAQFTFAAMQKLAHIPDMDVVERWIANRFEVPTSEELFNTVVHYFQLFGDYEEDYHAYIMALNVFQSYLLPLLSVVFQVTISATWGAGKSTALKAGAAIAYHGILGDSVSPASRVRLTEMVRPAWYQDEIDSTEKEDDGFGLSMIRTGYERGSYFIRWNNEKNEPDILEHFSTLTYAMHEDIANAALQSRSLAEIELSPTKDFKLAIANMLRNTYAPSISEALFFWRFGILDKAIHDEYYLVQKKNAFDDLKNEKFDVQKKRQELYEKLTKGFTEKEQALLKILVARESQLTFSAVFIERLLGVDVISYLIRALNKRRQDEAQPRDPDYEEFEKWIVNYIEAKELVSRYASPTFQKDDKLSSDSEISLKSIIESMTTKILGTGEDEHVQQIKPEPKTRTVAKWIKDLGFIRGKTWLHKRDGTHLYLTKELCERIYNMSEPTSIDEIALFQKKVVQ